MNERQNPPIYQFRQPSTQSMFERLLITSQETGAPLFRVTPRSIELFKMAKPDQGFAGLLDLETGEIDLVPAYNKDDGKIRDDFFYEDEPGKRKNYRVESPEPLGKNTGVMHTEALKLLKKNHKQGIILGFGIFKGEGIYLLDHMNTCALRILKANSSLAVG